MIRADGITGLLGQLAFVGRAVVGNRSLLRLELSYTGFLIMEWSVWIAMLVYAYGRGGTTEAGIVAFVQLVPAALFAPFGSVLGDRYRPGRVLLGGYLIQAATIGITAVVLLGDGPAVLAYAFGAVASTAVTVTRPTISAFTPTLARTPNELTAVNVAGGWVEAISTLIAPALTGLLLAIWQPGAVFAVMAVMLLVCALLVLPVPGPPPAGTADDRETVRHTMAVSLSVLRTQKPARVLAILLCADFIVLGSLDVLYPELAIGELGLESSWAGYLNAAFGLGATLGVVLTARMVGRARLIPSMMLGLAVYLTSFVVLAVDPTVATALLLLATAGAGRVALDVGSRTLLQRIAPSDVLASLFGLLEALMMVGLAIGALLVPVLVAVGGAQLALLGIGLLLPVAALLSGRSLLDVDRHATVPVVQIGLLRAQPLFAPLPADRLESVARSLTQSEVTAGTDVIRQGEDGDRFYVIASGTVEVIRDGERVAELRRGDGFGEIALLHDVPRNATCRATEDATLFALERADFLAALTGHPQSREAALRLADSRR